MRTEAGVSEASESQKKKGKGKAVEVSELASASTKSRLNRFVEASPVF